MCIWSQFMSSTHSTLPNTALHCTALHCTALHCTALHCTALHCTFHSYPGLSWNGILTHICENTTYVEQWIGESRNQRSGGSVVGWFWWNCIREGLLSTVLTDTVCVMYAFLSVITVQGNSCRSGTGPIFIPNIVKSLLSVLFSGLK